MAITFLVVDDCQDGADALKMLLEMLGYIAFCAYDGLSAVELARRELPDVIVMDLEMSGLDGFDTALAIRQILPVGTTTIAALTGWETATVRERAENAGFDHYFIKPIHLEEMLLTVADTRQSEETSVSPVKTDRRADRRMCERPGNERRHPPRLGSGARKSCASII